MYNKMTHKKFYEELHQYECSHFTIRDNNYRIEQGKLQVQNDNKWVNVSFWSINPNEILEHAKNGTMII